jgi:hypothetical protein
MNTRLRRAAIITTGTCLLTLAAGTALASIPDASGTIHACRKTAAPDKGLLRVLDTDAGQTCPNGWTPLDWAAAPRPGTLYGLHHAPGVTFDVYIGSSAQTFTVECPAGEVMISATGILYRVDGHEYRSEPPTEEAGSHATFSFFNPYSEPTQLQANYNCAKVTS